MNMTNRIPLRDRLIRSEYAQKSLALLLSVPCPMMLSVALLPF